jgi:hypothetical protein
MPTLPTLPELPELKMLGAPPTAWKGPLQPGIGYRPQNVGHVGNLANVGSSE